MGCRHADASGQLSAATPAPTAPNHPVSVQALAAGGIALRPAQDVGLILSRLRESAVVPRWLAAMGGAPLPWGWHCTVAGQAAVLSLLQAVWFCHRNL